ncbi:hypothetical protein OG233_13225 [Streptomyces sp. NBC_01218]|uniref:hypothetical protein n=1 Tax=Streptomyces sp. NBC_01218 TaxID=2903780 RepID=UPI002E149A99|nr:hypothetical protein OG233_13225 [Streptomyces sp. NBC_01218]
MAPQPEQPEESDEPERSARPGPSGRPEQGRRPSRAPRPERQRRAGRAQEAGEQPRQRKRTKTSRLADGRLLIADIDLELPPGRSPLQRALRTADINLPPGLRPRAGTPAEKAGETGERALSEE